MKAVRLASRRVSGQTHSQSIITQLRRRRRPLCIDVNETKGFLNSPLPTRGTSDSTFSVRTPIFLSGSEMRRFFSDYGDERDGYDQDEGQDQDDQTNVASDDDDFRQVAQEKPHRGRRSPPADVALDRFTHYVLNPNMVPLGTISHETWRKVVDTIQAWLVEVSDSRGYATDSASRLLDRLWVENFAATPTMMQHQRLSTLMASGRYEELLELQQALFRSWMECAFVRRVLRSESALINAENAFWRLTEFLADYDNSFPAEEYISLIAACLDIDDSDALGQERGAEKASNLLLQIFSASSLNSHESIVDRLSEFSDEIGPSFESCVLKLLQQNANSDIAMKLVETMATLKSSGNWPDLTLPDEAERILLESSLQKSEEEQQQYQVQGDALPKQAATLTPFEKETMEKRLVSLLSSATAGEERDDVENLIDRMTKLDPSQTLVIALVDFYVRMEDVEKASHWLQRLDATSLSTSSGSINSVLQLWAKHPGDRVAWRADELFKSIASRMVDSETGNVAFDLSSFKVLLDIWVSSKDPGANRKILELFSSMVGWSVPPDGEMLRHVLRVTKEDMSPSKLELVAVNIMEHWSSFEFEEKVWLAEDVMAVAAAVGGETSKTVTKLMERFQSDDIKPSQSVYRSALKAMGPPSTSPMDVMKLVESFSRNMDDIDLSLYSLAIHTLVQFDDTASEISSVCDTVLNLIQDHSGEIQDEDISSFLESVVRMLVSRKQYRTAGDFINKAEYVLLPSNPYDKTTQSSVIPLVCYQLMIVRNWYTDSTAPVVKSMFHHLKKLHNQGFSNLQPDAETYTGYLRACAALVEDVEPVLREMIDLYKSTGDESLKPSTKAFNVVLLSYSRQNIKKIQAGNRSVKMIGLMLDLGVSPDTKSVNYTLYNLTKSGSQYSFEMAMKLLDDLEKRGFLPEADSFTLHYILDACGGDKTTNSDTALKKCLSIFREIREKEMVGDSTYGILSKVLHGLLRKGDRADKVAGSILTLCCQDGRLSREVKERLRSTISKQSWIMQYERNLESNGAEPGSWSRNVPTETDAANVA